jgi:hypothetical protein
MRKFFGFLIVITAAVLALLFFLLFNISTFVNEGRVKEILEQSSFYDTAAFYIKDQIVKQSGFQLNEGTVFEELNEKITSDSIRADIDGGISNVFRALQDPTEENLVFPVRLSNNDSDLYFFEKYINLKNNKAFEVLVERNTYLLLMFATSLLFLLIGFLLCSGKITDRLLFLGIFSLSLSIFLIVTALLLKEFAPKYLDILVNRSQIFQEAKLLATIKRVLSNIIDRQFYLYLIEAVGFFILAAIVIWFRKIFTKDSLNDLDSKI